MSKFPHLIVNSGEVSAIFQSRDLEDQETQEATMSVCLSVCMYVTNIN